jgi:hypothetical protein
MEAEEMVLPDDLPEDDGEERGSIWKVILIVLALGLILVIALGLLRYWMVSYYGGG